MQSVARTLQWNTFQSYISFAFAYTYTRTYKIFKRFCRSFKYFILKFVWLIYRQFKCVCIVFAASAEDLFSFVEIDCLLFTITWSERQTNVKFVCRVICVVYSNRSAIYKGFIVDLKNNLRSFSLCWFGEMKSGSYKMELHCFWLCRLKIYFRDENVMSNKKVKN